MEGSGAEKPRRKERRSKVFPAEHEAGATKNEEPVDDVTGSWLKSPENLRSRATFVPLWVLGGIAVYGGVLLATFYDRGNNVVLGISLAAVGLTVMALAFYKRYVARANYLERTTSAAKAGIDSALRDISDVTDLPALLRLNRAQMDAYEALAREQASSSYRLSQVAMASGLFVVLGGCIAILATNQAETRLPVAVLSGVAGLTSGYLSRTYLRVYERTLQQLNFYFQQPLVTSYVLTAERLTGKMSSPKQDSGFERIIDSLLGGVGQPSGSDDARGPSVVERLRRSTEND